MTVGCRSSWQSIPISAVCLSVCTQGIYIQLVGYCPGYRFDYSTKYCLDSYTIPDTLRPHLVRTRAYIALASSFCGPCSHSVVQKYTQHTPCARTYRVRDACRERDALLATRTTLTDWCAHMHQTYAFSCTYSDYLQHIEPVRGLICETTCVSSRTTTRLVYLAVFDFC